MSHPEINSAVARYCPLWALLSSPYSFVSENSRATSQWVTHPGIALAPNSLNFGVPTTPKPVSSQKASARRPRRHTRTTRQSGSDTKLSHPGINSAVARYCPLWAPLSGPHGFVSGNSRATSQWVTHPGIALAPNSLNFGVPTTPKPVSSQKASC
ncbi:hypothetical protein L3X38_015302 [Prunus dulcis]|uniref:Uncharacterized protein n=1 Tax=Prunus dulcis TaxID=3755 RepID=A0AAD4ZJ95_PRUDU|nr:hypothetical protein L3X38_015302 [Prunus dulcis]